MKILKSICAVSLASLLLAASCDYGPGELRSDRANCYSPSGGYVIRGILRAGPSVCASTVGSTFDTPPSVRWAPYDLFAGQGCGWATQTIPFPGAPTPYYIDTWYRQLNVPTLGLWWCSQFSFEIDQPGTGEPGNPCRYQYYTCHHPVNP